MFVTSPDPNRDLPLAELLERRSKTPLQRNSGRSPYSPTTAIAQPDTRLSSWGLDTENLNPLQPHQASLGRPVSPVAPSTALRERDLKALEELFEHEGIEQVQADILHNLELLSPELCWEEDPFDFLREYL
jgi:hypothetical protein